MLNEKTLRYLGLRTQRQIILGAQENAGRGCSGLLVGITCSIHLESLKNGVKCDRRVAFFWDRKAVPLLIDT